MTIAYRRTNRGNRRLLPAEESLIKRIGFPERVEAIIRNIWSWEVGPDKIIEISEKERTGGLFAFSILIAIFWIGRLAKVQWLVSTGVGAIWLLIAILLYHATAKELKYARAKEGDEILLHPRPVKIWQDKRETIQFSRWQGKVIFFFLLASILYQGYTITGVMYLSSVIYMSLANHIIACKVENELAKFG